jgi:GT2 family glycosyltransferase
MGVGIAVPNLNQGRFLGAALDSLRLQLVAPRSAVLDAGSSDGSRELLQARQGELAYWRSAPDRGQAAAINEGLAWLIAADPAIDAVGWLNADDFFVTGGLDRLADALSAHPDWVAVAGRGLLAGEDGALGDEIPTARFSREAFAHACTICQPATLIRRAAWERVGGLDDTLEMCFDYDLWWRLADIGVIGYLDVVVAASRDHGSTKTRRRREQYFREATAIVRRETGAVPWHWYISRALERQVGYEVGRRPGLAGSIPAVCEAAVSYVRERFVGH